MTVWPTAPLRRLFRIVNGGTPTADAVNWDGGVLWATPVDLGRVNGGAITTTDRTLSTVGLATGSRTIQAGSLILSTRAPIGYVAETTNRTAFNQGCKGLQPTTPLDIRYYRYQLLTMAALLNAAGQGSTFVELTSETLASTPVAVPPLFQQQAIADYLDTETARIDTLIAKKRSLAAAVRHRLGSLISLRTAGRCAVSLNAVGACVPDGWTDPKLLRCFADVAYGIGDRSNPSGTYAVLGMGNIDDGGSVSGPPGGYVDSVDSRLILRVGELLFNRTNSLAKVGKVGLVRHLDTPTTFASYLVRLRTSDLALPEYLNYALNSTEFLGLARSAALPSIGQANLNPSRYGELKVPLPPLEVQRQVVSELDAERSQVERLVRSLDLSVDLLVERRQALITAAVTGELSMPGTAS